MVRTREIALGFVVVAMLAARPLPAAGKVSPPRRAPLLRIVAPARNVSAPAHPWVNVTVGFGVRRGLEADPATFRASARGRDVTALFRPRLVNGAVVGMQGRLLPPLLRLGRRNRMRVSVRTRRTAGRRPVREVVRLAFAAVEAPNHPPTPTIIAGGEVIRAGVPTLFDGSASVDPDGDLLDHRWDFGDGTTAAGPTPVHVFRTETADVTVRLTVDDGALAASVGKALLAAPQLDPGRTAGALRVDADRALEFGVIAPGSTASLVIRVANQDAAPRSQLKLRIVPDGGGITATPSAIDLGPGASMPLTVTFAPPQDGHQSGVVKIVPSEENDLVQLLAHVFAGQGAGAGPTLASGPVFHLDGSGGPAALGPDGARVTVDATARLCVRADAAGSRNPCFTRQDCDAGESCTGGAPQQLFPVDLCTEGGGHLFLLSEELFTLPAAGATPRTVGVMDLAFDSAWRRTAARVLGKTTTQTTHLACGRGIGRLYLAEHRDVRSSAECARTAAEDLVVVDTGDGETTTLMRRLDLVDRLNECRDDLDAVNDLELAPGTGDVYATFEGADVEQGGLFRVWPQALWLSPDVQGFFQVHPDGSALWVATADLGGTGVVALYRLAPSRLVNGPLAMADLTPCAVVLVPNNLGATFVDREAGSFAEGPGTDGGRVALVSFQTDGGTVALRPGRAPVLAQPLAVQGTVAIALDPGGTCRVLGTVMLEFLRTLRM